MWIFIYINSIYSHNVRIIKNSKLRHKRVNHEPNKLITCNATYSKMCGSPQNHIEMHEHVSENKS